MSSLVMLRVFLQVRHTRVSSESAIEEYYEFGRKLGQGTFGVVFEAKSKKDDQIWAIKAVNKEKVRQI